jgi:hypothetical protein
VTPFCSVAPVGLCRSFGRVDPLRRFAQGEISVDEYRERSELIARGTTESNQL